MLVLKLLKQSQPEKAETHTCHHQDISSGVQTFYPGGHILVGGVNPSEKYESQLGLLYYSQYMEKYKKFQTTNQYTLCCISALNPQCVKDFRSGIFRFLLEMFFSCRRFWSGFYCCLFGAPFGENKNVLSCRRPPCFSIVLGSMTVSIKVYRFRCLQYKYTIHTPSHKSSSTQKRQHQLIWTASKLAILILGITNVYPQKKIHQ